MSWIVDSRCAMAMVVRPAISTLSASRISDLGLGVDAGGGLVEDQDPRVERQRPREREQLLLPDRQRGAPLGHRAREPARQPVDEAVGVHGLDGAPDVLVGDAAVAEPDVVADRAGEQLHVLQHEAEERRAGRSSAISRTSTPSIRIAPRLDVVEPHQQVDDGGLAGARRADDRRRARPARPRTTRRWSTWIAARVAERHVVEHDVPVRRLWPRGRPAPGSVMTTAVSSSVKIRSEEAIAACRRLNFSDRSLIGRKNRCEYWMNATSAPSVSAPAMTRPPPYQMIRAVASAPITSIAG